MAEKGKDTIKMIGELDDVSLLPRNTPVGRVFVVRAGYWRDIMGEHKPKYVTFVRGENEWWIWHEGRGVKTALDNPKIPHYMMGEPKDERRKKMSKVTEQLDRIEAKIIADNEIKDTKYACDIAAFGSIKDKLDEISDKLDCMSDLCDIIDERDEALVNQEETIDRHLDRIHYLSDQLNELAEENAKLRKKNKRLKKKVKRVSAYIDEMENVELS